MFRLFLLTIFLIISPIFGLIENLYKTEHQCYSGCISNYGGSGLKLNACRNGCFFKLHRENCVDQCKLYSIDEQIQASCVMGCSMTHIENKNHESIKNFHPKTIIYVHPIMKSSHEENRNEFKDFLFQQEEKQNHIEKILNQLHLKWKYLTPKESKLPSWILLGLFLLTSIILWYLIITLCQNRPRYQQRSISSEELVFDKEYPPMKIKLTNI